MNRSRREIEVKLRFDRAEDARARLIGIGAALRAEREFEDNTLFDRERQLESVQQLLRVRRRGGRAWLTFKAKIDGEHRHSVRREEETSIEDAEAMWHILEAIGYSPWYRYQKYRTKFEIDGLKIALDETPLGCFVELEGEPETIDRVAGQLGFDAERYVRESYRELHVLKAQADGGEVGDLVFDSGTS
ncbi:MAG: class IV adenylate cyclase [bacterium]|nr:class IV adenylate cyclase [bacterium]